LFVLLSHRRHAPPIGRASLSIDRAIAGTFVVKRVTLEDVVQDERLTKASLGVDSERPRRRLAIVLRGESHDFVDGAEIALAEGDAIHVAEKIPCASRWSGDMIEIEWDPGTLDDGLPLPTTRLRLGPTTRARAGALAVRLRDTATTPESVAPALEELLAALRAEGAAFVPDRPRALAGRARTDQPLMQRIDAVLSDLGGAPMLVDLEASMGRTRSTLTRAIRRMHERYALLGRGGGRWRAIRDVYRLVVATILVSHPDATPREVARAVGYGSVEALDHAFRHAGLEAPATFGRAVRAA
jgi:hypothetical protein